MIFLKCSAWYNRTSCSNITIAFRVDFGSEKKKEEIDERILEHLGRLISIQPSFGKHGKIDHPSVTLAVHFLSRL